MKPDLTLTIPCHKIEPQQRARWSGHHVYQPDSRCRGEIHDFLTYAKENNLLQEKITGNVRVEIDLYYFKATRGDVDNVAKPIIDELVQCDVIDDDKYVNELEVKRIVNKESNPRTAYVKNKEDCGGLYTYHRIHNGAPSFKNGTHFLYFNGTQWNIHEKVDDKTLGIYCSKSGLSVGAIENKWICAMESGDEQMPSWFRVGIHYDYIVIRIYRVDGNDLNERQPNNLMIKYGAKKE